MEAGALHYYLLEFSDVFLLGSGDGGAMYSSHADTFPFSLLSVLPLKPVIPSQQPIRKDDKLNLQAVQAGVQKLLL